MLIKLKNVIIAGLRKTVETKIDDDIWSKLKPALAGLKDYMPADEYAVIMGNLYGEEREFFVNMMIDLWDRIRTMPVTYQSEEKADPIVYLHYFTGSADWYITERDIDTDNTGQHQAFGYADLGCPEIGYISIAELISYGIELDLYWTPVPLSTVKAKRG